MFVVEKHFKSSGHITGKAQNAYRIVKNTFSIIEQRTKEKVCK